MMPIRQARSDRCFTVVEILIAGRARTVLTLRTTKSALGLMSKSETGHGRKNSERAKRVRSDPLIRLRAQILGCFGPQSENPSWIIKRHSAIASANDSTNELVGIFVGRFVDSALAMVGEDSAAGLLNALWGAALLSIEALRFGGGGGSDSGSGLPRFRLPVVPFFERPESMGIGTTLPRPSPAS